MREKIHWDPLASKTFQISEKPFIVLVMLIIIIVFKENYTIANENITVEMIKIEAIFNSNSTPDENRNLKIAMNGNETRRIKENFHRRHEILQSRDSWTKIGWSRLGQDRKKITNLRPARTRSPPDRENSENLGPIRTGGSPGGTWIPATEIL